MVAYRLQLIAINKGIVARMEALRDRLQKRLRGCAKRWTGCGSCITGFDEGVEGSALASARKHQTETNGKIRSTQGHDLGD